MSTSVSAILRGTTNVYVINFWFKLAKCENVYNLIGKIEKFITELTKI